MYYVCTCMYYVCVYVCVFVCVCVCVCMYVCMYVHVCTVCTVLRVYVQPHCVCTASSAYSISKEATSVLLEAIETGEEVSMAEHTTKCRAAVRNAIKKKEEA